MVGGEKKKKNDPVFMETQLTTKDTLTHGKERSGGGGSEKRSGHKNGKRNLLLSAPALILRWMTPTLRVLSTGPPRDAPAQILEAHGLYS